MKRHLAAACILAPAAIIATSMPAQAAAPAQLVAPSASGMHVNSVQVAVMKGAAPLKALRSSTQKCGGTVVDKKMVLDPKTKKTVAELDIYQNQANGLTAIACLRHAGITKGVRTQTSVTIMGAKTLASAKAGKYVVGVKAYGNFISYAGPAAIGGLSGKHCVVVTGSIKAGGKTIMVPALPYCATK